MKTKRVVLMGGLGNQLFQYALALRLSRDKNSRTLLDQNLGTLRLNKEGQPELDGLLLSKSIDIAELRHTPKLLKRVVGLLIRTRLNSKLPYGSILSILLGLLGKIVLSIYFKENIKLFVARDAGWNSSVELNKKNFFIGYFQTYRYSDLDNELEQLKEILPRVLGNGYSELVTKAQSEQPLVVHVRLTDYRVEEKFGIPSSEYYRKAIEMQWMTNKYKKIWLFSDDLEASVDFIPEDFRKHVSNVSHEELDSVQTMNVMRLGHGFVLGNSTFSWWAAYLSQKVNPIVTYPDPWFLAMPNPKEMWPVSWVSIPR
jgi:hypothetical protein